MKSGPETKDVPPTGDAQEQTQEPVARLESAQTTAFEAELHKALRPMTPSSGFTERVLAAAYADKARAGQTRQRPQAKVLPFRPWRLAIGSTLAASLVAGTFTAEAWHVRRERERKQALANRQFQTATRITDQALAHTRAQLERAGVFRAD